MARAARPGLKRALRGTQNMFMPEKIDRISAISLEGIEKIKSEKKLPKTRSEQSRKPANGL